MPNRPGRERKIENIAGGFIVRDADGQALAYIYSRPTETGQPLSAVASALRPFASQLAAVPPAVLVSSDQGYCLADH